VVFVVLKIIKSSNLGFKGLWIMAYVLLHCDYIPRFVLSRQFDIGHRSDVIRRVAEKSGRRRGSRGRSDQGKLFTSNWTSNCVVTNVFLVTRRKRNKQLKIGRSGGKLTRKEWRSVRRERGTSPNIQNHLRTFRAKATTICLLVAKTEGLATIIIERKWACDRCRSQAMTNTRTPRVWIGRAAKQEKYAPCTTPASRNVLKLCWKKTQCWICIHREW